MAAVEVSRPVERAVADSSIGVKACPHCESLVWVRSHVRWYEHLRKGLSSTRPFRCAQCGHHAWLAVRDVEPATAACFEAVTVSSRDVNLLALDEAVRRDAGPAPRALPVAHVPPRAAPSDWTLELVARFSAGTPNAPAISTRIVPSVPRPAPDEGDEHEQPVRVA